jgi:Domain of unknown function (DUF4159)
MRRLKFGLIVAVLLVVVAVAVPLAQRGGYSNTSYSGNVRYDGRFTFVRLSCRWGRGRAAPWAHDYPRGEEHFLKMFTELSNVQAHLTESSVMTFSDPELFKFPVAYMAEPGYWYLSTEQEVKNLRSYLLKGGFLIFDDFRGGGEWANLDLQMSRAFPEGRWIDIDANHPIFHSFFEINSLDIIPQAYDVGRPVFRGLFVDNDPNKRMLAIAGFNSDMSEFWEWSDTGYAPVEANNEAYKLGINLFMYGITH